jgi:dephospho-CoA kinase
VVVHDIPLLVETGRAGYDLVVVVDAPDEVRLRRLVERGLPEDEARRRMAAQATREERLAVADVVIDNGGDREDLDEQVLELWRELVERLR